MRHQPLDLAFGEIAPFNCEVYDGWWVFLGCRFHRDKMLLPNAKWITNTLLLHSSRSRGERYQWLSQQLVLASNHRKFVSFVCVYADRSLLTCRRYYYDGPPMPKIGTHVLR